MPQGCSRAFLDLKFERLKVVPVHFRVSILNALRLFLCIFEFQAVMPYDCFCAFLNLKFECLEVVPVHWDLKFESLQVVLVQFRISSLNALQLFLCIFESQV